MTDSDSAGFKIRSFIGGSVPKDSVIHAYIPDVFGKERRKDAPSKEGKLGVEGIDTEILLEALNRAGVTCESTQEKSRAVTVADLYEAGLSGKRIRRLCAKSSCAVCRFRSAFQQARSSI